jgi:hypothetical protein
MAMSLADGLLPYMFWWMNPRDLLALLTVLPTCQFHFKSWLIGTPRYFLVRSLFSACQHNLCGVTTGFLLLVMWINVHFPILDSVWQFRAARSSWRRVYFDLIPFACKEGNHLWRVGWSILCSQTCRWWSLGLMTVLYGVPDGMSAVDEFPL